MIGAVLWKQVPQEDWTLQDTEGAVVLSERTQLGREALEVEGDKCILAFGCLQTLQLALLLEPDLEELFQSSEALIPTSCSFQGHFSYAYNHKESTRLEQQPVECQVL